MKSGAAHILIRLSSAIRSHPEFVAGAVVIVSLIVLVVLGWK
jgi:hypothetical protein